MPKRNAKEQALVEKVLTSFQKNKDYIMDKYYNLFLNKLKVKGLDYEQKDYILRRFWFDGNVAFFIVAGTKGSEENPLGLPALCPFAASTYNTYDFPITVNLINKRGVPFIPTTPQYVNKDVVLIYVLRNKRPIKYLVEFYAKKIALVESVIQTQLLANKMPFVFTTTPENKTKMETLWNRILDDFNALWLDEEEASQVKVLLTGGGNNLDKLIQYANDLENKLKEAIGLENLGVHEKKEHLINREVASNDEVTDDAKASVIDMLEEASEMVFKTFNYSLKFYWEESIKKELLLEEEEEEDSPNDEEEEEMV